MKSPLPEISGMGSDRNKQSLGGEQNVLRTTTPKGKEVPAPAGYFIT